MAGQFRERLTIYLVTFNCIKIFRFNILPSYAVNVIEIRTHFAKAACCIVAIHSIKGKSRISVIFQDLFLKFQQHANN